MGNLLSFIFVVLVMIIGIGACWAIAASGSSTTATTDTYGDHPPAATIQQNNASASMAVKTMPVLFIGFFVMICVILAAAVAWLWKTGKSKPSKY